MGIMHTYHCHDFGPTYTQKAPREEHVGGFREISDSAIPLMSTDKFPAVVATIALEGVRGEAACTG